MKGGHFKLGLFVCVAAVLLVVFLLVLGTLDRFKPTLRAETYFEESVQNLQVGAPVRFRGLNTGRVTAIDFAAAVYPEAADLERELGSRIGSYIRVEIALDLNVWTRLGIDDAEASLREGVAEGLRVRLATSGLGGPVFLQTGYEDPARFPAPALPWEPKAVHIPSAPSTAGAIVESLYSLLQKLDRADLITDLSDFAELGRTINTLVARLESDEVVASAGAALRELEATSASAGELLADPRLDALLDDASTTMRSARLIVEGREGDVAGLLDDLASMASELDRAAVSLTGLTRTVEEGELVARLRLAADELGPAGADVRALAGRLDRFVRANEAQIADTVRALRDASLEFEALLEELKANPSRVLSDPPPRGEGG